MADLDRVPNVWVFNGIQGKFPSGVFSRKDLAEQWINKHRLTGILTRYPLDKGIYDWALDENLLSPSKEDQKTAFFIGKFSSAGQEHYHYEDGALG